MGGIGWAEVLAASGRSCCINEHPPGASSVKPQGGLCLGKGAFPPLACPWLLGLPCAQREGEPCSGSPPVVPLFQEASAQEPGQAECVLRSVHLAALGTDTTAQSFLFSLLNFIFCHVCVHIVRTDPEPPVCLYPVSQEAVAQCYTQDTSEDAVEIQAASVTWCPSYSLTHLPATLALLSSWEAPGCPPFFLCHFKSVIQMESDSM